MTTVLYCGKVDSMDDLTKKLLFLLDRIETENDPNLAKMRHMLVQEAGFDIKYCYEASQFMN